eukprot:237961_1
MTEGITGNADKTQINAFYTDKTQINDVNSASKIGKESLHQFNENDICEKIYQYVYNDVNYQADLSRTKKTILKKSLNGSKIFKIPSEFRKTVLHAAMSNIVEQDTFDIIFEGFVTCIKKSPLPVKIASEERIAEILFHYPLNNLLATITSKKINGEHFIKSVKDTSIIKMMTGWKQQDVYQIQAILFKHYTFTKSEFKQKMNKIFASRHSNILSEEVCDKIKQIVLGFDVESLHFRIKNDKNIDQFSDKIINMVDELLDNNIKEHNDEFVKQIYDLIAHCFIPDASIFKHNTPNIWQTCGNWVCSNCSNYNFNNFIGKKMNTNLSVCTLCGIPQIDVVVMKLRNRDVFGMVSDTIDEKNNNVDEKNTDDIDTMINTAAEHKSFHLLCPSRNDNKKCGSILRLAKMCIVYKRWLYTVYKKTNGNDDIEKTIQVDIEKFTDNETFQHIFVEKIKTMNKLTEEHRNLLLTLLDKITIKIFSNLKRKEFIAYVKQHITIKAAVSARLYSQILKVLKTKAQNKQFGKFLSDLDMKNVNSDYYHIVKVHINNGDKESIQ